jgi:hypothetical protein
MSAFSGKANTGLEIHHFAGFGPRGKNSNQNLKTTGKTSRKALPVECTDFLTPLDV